MKRMLSLCAAALCLTLALTPTALAADFEPAVPDAKVCYPTSIVRNDDGTELKKIYDLSPEDDPAGIPRSNFQQDGFQYNLTDLLKQELPENESRQHTEHVSVESAKKDMESVLALLPQEREFITDDGLMGTLTLKLDTVQVEPSGYGSSTKQLSVKRSYPNLAEQDTQYIPKSIEDGGRTLTLSDIQWQTDNTANMDGYAVGDRFTAVAVYIGSATSSYVKGYTVTADYIGTVSRIALNRVRYVAIFEGVPIQSAEPAKTAGAVSLRWSYVLIPLGIVAAAGAGVGGGASGVVTPGSTVSGGNYQPSVLFTDVTSELYHKNGSLGKIEIPALGLSVWIYQGTDSKTLVKGVGHFEDTSIWEGNVCLAAHNRGANSYFGQIHTLDIGDKITLTTKLGTRSYHVTDVSKVSETDRSGLADSGENMLTLYTCVRNQRDQRWCVTAVET